MVSGSVDSGCHKLSENIWFVWSKTSYSRVKVEMSPMRDERTNEQTTSKDRASQLLIWETLSLANRNLELGTRNFHLCKLTEMLKTNILLALWYFTNVKIIIHLSKLLNVFTEIFVTHRKGRTRHCAF